jgi:DNA-binding winged helix-turn-helix (wHTH) protein
MKLHFADCVLDTATLSLTRGGAPVAVEPQVFDLIRLLAEQSDRVVTRDELVVAVWGGRIVSESAISARVAAARRAVGDDGKRQALIRTIARRGLQMSVPVTHSEPEVGESSSPYPRVSQGALDVHYASSLAATR